MTDNDLASWLRERPKWLQKAANLIFTNKEVEKEDIIHLSNLCIKEVLGQLEDSKDLLAINVLSDENPRNLRICSICDVKGINALAPRKPLEFGAGNLAVVYGLNGSGKSGYVRILKHACGARHPGILYQDVFSPTDTVQRCCITYELEGKQTPLEWSADSGVVNDLRSVDIFDALCGRVYIINENEVTYEPPILSIFSDLIEFCGKVSSILDDKINEHVCKKPQLPNEYSSAVLGLWYTNLSSETKPEDVAMKCNWSENDEQELLDLQKRLSEKSPGEKASQIRKQKEHLDFLVENLEQSLELLSDENCLKIIELKRDSISKHTAAKVAAEKVFSGSPLEGIGSETWKQLWEQARKYSEEYAFKGLDFPFTGESAHCVLCQQPLSEDAMKRLQSFEEFVKGKLQREAATAGKSYKDALDNIGDFPTEVAIKTRADAAGLMQDEDSAPLINFYKELNERRPQLSQEESDMDSSPLPQCNEWLDKAHSISDKYEEAAKKYDSDVQGDNRSELKDKLLEMQTRKWLSQQKSSIEDEMTRLKVIDVLIAAKSLTTTTGISRKKGEIAQEVITDAFVKRFNKEIENLGAKKIRIELVKTRVDIGRVLHRLQLCGAAEQCSLDEVLSEGEYRVVSLSAFLADVVGKTNTATFVFDDPISSLDQDFEEAVVRRLVSLAKDRQVIVFTHRLSLLGLLQDYGKKADCEPNVICVRQEAWGTGEPGETPLFAKKPKKALNALLNDRLPRARKLLDQDGWECYEPIAKSICSDYRILLERMIECDLLADVVQRYRRAVNTSGKIEKLARIEDSDCQFFDNMMIKYSRYEHSQSGEAPVSLPDPDELQEDMEDLKRWREEFVERCAQGTNQLSNTAGKW